MESDLLVLALGGRGKDRGEQLWGSNCSEESDPGGEGSVVRMVG